MSSLIEAARGYLERRGKRPKAIGGGIWRWTLPDMTPDRTPEELPKVIFDRLQSQADFPWLFDSRDEAMEAAVRATAVAMAAGEKLPEGSVESPVTFAFNYKCRICGSDSYDQAWAAPDLCRACESELKGR